VDAKCVHGVDRTSRHTALDVTSDVGSFEASTQPSKLVPGAGLAEESLTRSTVAIAGAGSFAEAETPDVLLTVRQPT